MRSKIKKKRERDRIGLLTKNVYPFDREKKEPYQ